MFNKFLSSIYRFFYKRNLKFHHKLKYGKRCLVSKSSTFEGYNSLDDDCVLRHTKMGYGSYCGSHCYFLNTNIGRFCSIADNITIAVGNHPVDTFVCNHPAFYSLSKQAGFTYAKKQMFEDIKYIDQANQISVEIGDGVWIGSNVTIINNVKIGEGAIIAAGAVVNKDVAPYEIVGGLPAKTIKKRFTDEQIDFLLKYKLYEKDLSFFKNHVDEMTNIETFIQNHIHEI